MEFRHINILKINLSVSKKHSKQKNKNMRMEAALDLLLDIENKITIISENLGYKNSGHFAKLFKEYYGISPKEYRNKNIE